MFYTGQLIVAQGETVTAEIEQLLDSYRAEYELSIGYSGSLAQLLAGHAILILILPDPLFYGHGYFRPEQ